MRDVCRYRGFTLLELLVAIAVFSVLSALAYGGLSAVTQTRQATEKETERLAQLQQAWLIMQRDIQQAVDRGVRDQYGDRQPALRGSELGELRLELTRAGYRNPAGQLRAAVVRVGYRLEDGVLERLSWRDLDRGLEAEPAASRLVENVQAVDIRYLGQGTEWREDWPPQGPIVVDTLPRAVEVSLDLEDWGRVTRVFVVPVGNI